MAIFYAGNAEYNDAEEALERLQSLLLARVQNKLGQEDELEYRQLRRALMREPGIKERLPRLVTVNSDTGGVWSVLRDVSDRWEPRRVFVREQMQAALDWVRSPEGQEAVSSSSWTGIATAHDRLLAARKLLPLAEATVAGLIAELERPQGNGGPPLEDREEAIRNLKDLQKVLGSIIAELEAGADTLKAKLLDEAAGYVSRAAKALRNDPMPYLVSAGLCALLSLFGAGTLGGYLAGVAATVRKNAHGAEL
jgi:hypothetical protein